MGGGGGGEWGMCIFSSTPSGWVEDETKPQEIETSDFQFGARKVPVQEKDGPIQWPKHATAASKRHGTWPFNAKCSSLT